MIVHSHGDAGKASTKSIRRQQLVEAVRRMAKAFRTEGPEGRASDYIHHLPDVLATAPDVPIVLWPRCSGRVQDHKGNLDEQEANLRREIERLCGRVIATFRRVGSGWMHEGHWSSLEAAADYAREHGAILVAESTSRFIRSVDWTTTNQQARPTVQEFEQMAQACHGVLLATIHHPDIDPGEERSVQTQRGQQEKGRKGGRPFKSKRSRREQLRPRVQELHEQGRSIRQISKLLNVPKTTVDEWVKSQF